VANPLKRLPPHLLRLLLQLQHLLLKPPLHLLPKPLPLRLLHLLPKPLPLRLPHLPLQKQSTKQRASLKQYKKPA